MKTLRIALLTLLASPFFQINDLQGYTRKDAARHFKATLKTLVSVGSVAGAVKCGKDLKVLLDQPGISANTFVKDLKVKNLALVGTSLLLSLSYAKSAYDELKNK